MEQTTELASHGGAMVHAARLPQDRSQWPDGARRAFRELLRELDRWCRQHDRTASTNEWVAEQAVRQCW